MIVKLIHPQPSKETLDTLRELFEAGLVEFLPSGRVWLTVTAREMLAEEDGQDDEVRGGEWDDYDPDKPTQPGNS
jgi:hypothetical protein